MKGRKFLAMLCAIMMLVMNFSSCVPGLAEVVNPANPELTERVDVQEDAEPAQEVKAKAAEADDAADPEEKGTDPGAEASEVDDAVSSEETPAEGDTEENAANADEVDGALKDTADPETDGDEAEGEDEAEQTEVENESEEPTEVGDKDEETEGTSGEDADAQADADPETAADETQQESGEEGESETEPTEGEPAGEEEAGEEDAAEEEPVELTLTDLAASADNVFPGEAIHFTFNATGADVVDYCISGVDGIVDAGEVVENALDWTPGAAGIYTVTITAVQGAEVLEDSLTVTVRPDYSEVKIYFTALDENDNVILGNREVELEKGAYALAEAGPVAFDNYEYVRTLSNGVKLDGLVYSEEDRAWLYSFGDVTEPLTLDTALEVRFNELFNKKVYEYDDRNIHAVIRVRKAEDVPDDANFVVTPVTKHTHGYNYDAYMDALNEQPVEQEYNEDNTLLYDFAFMVEKKDEDGMPTGEFYEFQPASGTIRIEVTFKKNQISDGLGAEDADAVEINHLPLESGVRDGVESTAEATNISANDIIVENVTDTAKVDLDGSTDQVDFKLDSLSIVAITVPGGSFWYEASFAFNLADGLSANDFVSDDYYLVATVEHDSTDYYWSKKIDQAMLNNGLLFTNQFSQTATNGERVFWDAFLNVKNQQLPGYFGPVVGDEFTISIYKLPQYSSFAPSNIASYKKEDTLYCYKVGDALPQTQVINGTGSSTITCSLSALPTYDVEVKTANATAATLSGYSVYASITEGSNTYYAVSDAVTTVPAAGTTVSFSKFQTQNGDILFYDGSQEISGLGLATVPAVFAQPGDYWKLAYAGNGVVTYADGDILDDVYQAAIKTDTAEITLTELAHHDTEIRFYDIDATVYPATATTPMYIDWDAQTKAPTLTKNYFVLATLKNGNATVGWAINPVNLNGNAVTKTSFREFYPYGEDGSSRNDADLMAYVKDQYTLTTRLYQYGGDVAANQLTYSELTSKGSELPEDGYEFGGNNNVAGEDKNIIQLKEAYEKSYFVRVRIDPDATTGFDTGDYFYVFVSVEHASTGVDTFAAKQVTFGNPSSLPKDDDGYAYVDVEFTDEDWVNGDAAAKVNKFTGNEVGIDVKLVKSGTAADSDSNDGVCTPRTVSNIIKGEKTIVYSEGGTAKGYSVSYDTKKTGGKDKYYEITDDTLHTTDCYDFIDLTKIDATNDYNYLSVLGGGVYYGITAEQFDQRNHIQSNFAVNNYDGASNVVEADLASNSGVIVAANATADGNGKKINIGESHSGDVLLYIDGDESCLLNPRDFVYVIPSDPEEMSTDIIEPIIRHGDDISEELLTHAPNYTPSPISSSTRLDLDILDYPSDATIYIDGDALISYLTGGRLRITKHPNQTIVFNFDSTASLELGEFYCRYSRTEAWKDPGNKSDTPTTKGDKNNFIDNLARHIVWNLNSVQSVGLGMTTGIFLLPDDRSTATINATSSGWIISDGTFTNPSGEWHSVYGDMPDIKTANLNVNKTVNGKTPKAKETFEFTLDHLITATEGANYWNALVVNPDAEDEAGKLVVTNESGTIKFDGISEMEIGWNVYRISEKGMTAATSGQYTIDSRKIYALVRFNSTSAASTVKVAGTPKYYIEAKEGETPTLYLDIDTFNKDASTYKAAVGTEPGEGKIGLVATTSPTFENEFASACSVTLEATKTLSGATLENNQFSFTLTGEGQNQTKKNDENGKVTFDAITYDDSALGNSYTYTVKEVMPNPVPVGYTYDESEYQVTVKVDEDPEDATKLLATKEIKKLKDANGDDVDASEQIVSGISFANEYQEATGSVTFKAKKTFTNGTIKDKGFQLKLTQVNGNNSETQATENVVLSSTETKNLTAEASTEIVTFNSIEFKRNLDRNDVTDDAGTAKEYWFLIEETVPTDVDANNIKDSIKYDTTSQKWIKVTLRDNGDGTLIATKDPVATSAGGVDLDATFTNEQLGALTVTKSWEGEDIGNEAKAALRITISGKDIGGEGVNTLTIGYADLPYEKNNLEVGEKYTVEETNAGELNANYVLVTGESTTKVEGVEITEEGATAELINNYESKTGKGEVKVQKTLSGRDWTTDDSFEFTITPVGDAPAFTPNTLTITNADENHTKSFGQVTFEAPGTYSWDIVETHHGETINGLAYDSEEKKTVTIEVEAGESDLVAKSGSALVQTAEFTNTYTAPTTPTFEKKVKDTNDSTGETSGWQDSADHDITDEVPFLLKAKLADNVTDYQTYHIRICDTMEKGLTFKEIKSATLKLSNGTEESIELPEGALNKIDGQNFTLTLEWKGEIAGAKISKAGINSAEVLVEYTAELNDDAVVGEKGNLNTAYLRYSNDTTKADGGDFDSEEGTDKTEEDSVIVFTYKVEVDKVKADGISPLAGAEFTLQKIDAHGAAVGQTNYTATKNDNGDTFTFKGLDDGIYKLTETKVPAGYTPIDPITFEVKANHKTIVNDLDASDAKRSTVLTSLTGEKMSGEIVFTNANNAVTAKVANEENVTETELPLVAKKVIVGRDFKDTDRFTFRLAECPNNPEGGAVMPDKRVGEANVDNGFTVEFGKVKFSKPGEYKFLITEDAGKISDLKYDTNPDVTTESGAKKHIIKVTVDFDENGKLQVVEAEPKTYTTTIENTYLAKTVGIQFEVNKQLAGRSWKNGDAFEFELKLDPADQSGVEMPENRIIRITNETPNQTQWFDEVRFSEEGRYTFTIAEIDPETKGGKRIQGVSYDTTTKNIVVNVEDDQDLGKLYITSRTDCGIYAFVNDYAAYGEVTFEGNKTLVGAKLSDGYVFTFKIYENINGRDVCVGTAYNDAAGVIHYPTLPYTEGDLGTHVYSVKEVSTDSENITVDRNIYEVTVKVEDNGDGTLKVTPSDNYKKLDFVNTVKEGESLTVTKTVVSNTTADKTKAFKFTVILDKNLNGKYGDMEFTNGMATFELKDREYKSATNLPQGTVYIVQEENAEGFISSGSVRGIIESAPKTAAFTNIRREGNLTVKKTVVSGTDAVKNMNFHFTVVLSDTSVSGTYGDMTFNKGIAGFVLKDGESATATGLPALISYTVAEDSYEFFETTAVNAQSVIDYGGTKVAEFTNTYVAPTTTAPIETPTVTPTVTPAPTPTTTPDETPTVTPTVTPEATPTATPEATPTVTPTPTPTTTYRTTTGGGGGRTTPAPTPIPRIDIIGKKVWLDENNRYNTRPESITVQLYADGALTDATPVWSDVDTNAWTYTFSRLPEVTATGIKINYTVQELPVDGYETIINGTTITNKLIPQTPKSFMDLVGKKTWVDNDNVAGLRPNIITVHLQRDGQEFETRTVTAVNDWTYSFNEVPVDDGYGNLYTYAIVEEKVPHYVSRIMGFDLVNILVPDEGSFTPEGPNSQETPNGKYTPTGNIPSRNTNTRLPNLTGLNEEDFAELIDLFGYGTPLFGMLGTGDEIPAYTFVFGGIGVAALIGLIVTRRKKRGIA